MPDLAPKNPPVTDPEQGTFQCAHTFDFDLEAGERQVAYMPHQVNYGFLSIAFADRTKATLEVTCSAVAKIQSGDAMWVVVTPSSNFLSIGSRLTGIRVTAIEATQVQACL
jgi:hypothetical protein